MIAALFVETNGCYYGIECVDPWDIKRDARLYSGPWPVVAHPPCERWGRFSEGTTTKKDRVTGDDGGCFESALKSVLAYGGVLEHPAHSKAWDAFKLRKPNPSGWTECWPNAWVCEVSQGHYGHPAMKLTWLFVVGPKPPELIWGKTEQRILPHISEKYGYEYARRRGIVSNQSTKQRQRTPPEFRDLLISIASNCPSQGLERCA